MDRHLNRLNLEIKRLEEEGQIIPLPSTNPPNETNGTATPNGTPAAVIQQVTAIAGQTLTVPSAPRSAPPAQRSVSQNGIPLPTSGLQSQTGTPTPSSARTSQKRKAAMAFRRDSSVDDAAGDEDSQVYCFCQQVSYGEMVACDNETCEREWFHYPCVGLTSPPQGTWYCRECLVKIAGQKQRQLEKKKVVK
jgi:chromatin modification-related protein YNG2